MIKKTASRIDKQDPTLEATALPVPVTVTEAETPPTLPIIEAESVELPVIESETVSLPVIEAEIPSPSAEGDKDAKDMKILELRIAELEDKFIKLQSELSDLVKKKKKKKKEKKDKKESKKKR